MWIEMMSNRTESISSLTWAKRWTDHDTKRTKLSFLNVGDHIYIYSDTSSILDSIIETIGPFWLSKYALQSEHCLASSTSPKIYFLNFKLYVLADSSPERVAFDQEIGNSFPLGTLSTWIPEAQAQAQAQTRDQPGSLQASYWAQTDIHSRSLNCRTFQVCAEVGRGGYGRKGVVVRINSLDSPWGEDDIREVAKLNIDAVVMPKVNSLIVCNQGWKILRRWCLQILYSRLLTNRFYWHFIVYLMGLPICELCCGILASWHWMMGEDVSWTEEHLYWLPAILELMIFFSIWHWGSLAPQLSMTVRRSDCIVDLVSRRLWTSLH